MGKRNSLASRPALVVVAMSAWCGAVGYACFAGVGHVMGLPMTGGDWLAIALMAGTGLMGGVVAILHERWRASAAP